MPPRTPDFFDRTHSCTHHLFANVGRRLKMKPPTYLLTLVVLLMSRDVSCSLTQRLVSFKRALNMSDPGKLQVQLNTLGCYNMELYCAPRHQANRVYLANLCAHMIKTDIPPWTSSLYTYFHIAHLTGQHFKSKELKLKGTESLIFYWRNR